MEDEEEERVAAGQGVIFVLEDAQLEVAQVGKVGHARRGVEGLPATWVQHEKPACRQASRVLQAWPQLLRALRPMPYS